MDSTLETEAVKSGLAFLFAQATDLLRRRANRRERDEESVADPQLDESVLEGSLHPVSADDLPDQPLAALEALCRQAESRLEGAEFSAQDPACMAIVEELRSALEAAIGQRVTFGWETGRAPSGTRLGEVPPPVAPPASGTHVSGERSVAVEENSGVINTGDQTIIG